MCSLELRLSAVFVGLVTTVGLLQFLSFQTGTRHTAEERLKRANHLLQNAKQNFRHAEEILESSLHVQPESPAVPLHAQPQVVKNLQPTIAVPKGWLPHARPVNLELRLPQHVREQPALSSHQAMFRQYGFNLKLSNEIPLVQKWPDVRNDQCKARKWPSVNEMPKASIVIIFYNEPLSTLLRNVVSVLNRSPPELVGEIVLVDDHSNLEELSLLPEHLDRLKQELPPDKVRLVRRTIHNGIVGARNQGAKEARYPILVILDSHAQVCDGWLEPLIGRIHHDRKRVVVPNLSGINVETMELIKGGTWPPNRGSFNWRLTFDIIRADEELDILEHDVDKRTAAIKSPVMPGGLFAMDREYFFELGMYDPEILFYGAEHVEMSFRIWMCGGSMEISPCSNIGHVYREFDRFGVDTQLTNVNIGHQLDVNDGRVAEVWMDEYKKLFFRYRPMTIASLGDLEPRKELRNKLQCKSFQWFLDNVVRDMYAPAFDASFGHLSDSQSQLCVDGCRQLDGPLQIQGCSHDIPSQSLSISSDGYLGFSTQGQKHICVRVDLILQMPCDSEGAARWEFHGNGQLHSIDRPGLCLSRTPTGQEEELRLSQCENINRQKWKLNKGQGTHGTLSDLDEGVCLDNMQRQSGPAGMYSCHGGGTQQWQLTSEGKISCNSVCLGISPQASIGSCLHNDPSFQWLWDGPHLKPKLMPHLCLEQQPSLHRAELRACTEDGSNPQQNWKFTAGHATA